MEEPGRADSELECRSHPPTRDRGWRGRRLRAWKPSAPPCGRGRDCSPREEAAAGPASPAARPLAVSAGPPPPPCPARLSAVTTGLPLPPVPPRRARAEVRHQLGSPMAAKRKRVPTAAPRDPAARGATSSGWVPCDVAARGGRLRARGRPAGTGGADPGRGAAPQERHRRSRTVSECPTLRVRAPGETDPAIPPTLARLVLG
ncbi:hypothetical protein PAL_GLEAN10018139 [Pteropus alecto]|uniref:Uncharacterized protein n=1 Tax=Pteropus alecto TaxID=9402 RepID=L5KYL2_PTEAL|nr:hypothetical protein PAL_GLEAN10018139 [Pteropus alecto]